MTNVVLCGGSGTRLWPISRTLMPKQFVRLFEERSLFQMCVERNAHVCAHQLIIANTEHYFLAYDQLISLGYTEASYLLEPIGRNTAPAIALACMRLDPQEIVLITPSDHLITDTPRYHEALKRAEALAHEGYLVTFGITPSAPETGFGYIHAQAEVVVQFHEKPDAASAQRYVEAGYYWNSGMFCFKVETLLSELARYAPEIYDGCRIASEEARLEGMISMQSMRAIPEESIDYALMEHSDRVRVVGADMGWSDVGSFDALYEVLPHDSQGNTPYPHHLTIDSHNNLIVGEGRTIATIDVEDLLIVDTADALLITHRGSSQKVKHIVSTLKQQPTQLHNVHLTAHRPWGTYTVLEDAQGYKIKRITVLPNKRLSLQKHFHRNEHWIVLSGTATITIEDHTYLVYPNESTYIKAGAIHRLANEGKIPLIIIEVQVGEYTGEDDIIRLEDEYNRV